MYVHKQVPTIHLLCTLREREKERVCVCTLTGTYNISPIHIIRFVNVYTYSLSVHNMQSYTHTHTNKVGYGAGFIRFLPAGSRDFVIDQVCVRMCMCMYSHKSYSFSLYSLFLYLSFLSLFLRPAFPSVSLFCSFFLSLSLSPSHSLRYL